MVFPVNLGFYGKKIIYILLKRYFATKLELMKALKDVAILNEPTYIIDHSIPNSTYHLIVNIIFQ